MKKYKFDKENLQFRESRRDIRPFLVRTAVFIILSFLGFILVYILYSLFFDTRVQSDLKLENRKIEEEYRMISGKMARLDSVIGDMKARDVEIYKSMFNTAPFDKDDIDSLIALFFPQDNRFRVPKDINDAAVAAAGITRRLDSLASVMTKAKDSLRFVPSIPPLKEMDPYQVSASIGMQINPYYKQHAMHEGLDILAAEGTEIIATADGTVTEVKRSRGSEGNTVTITHGNDYTTCFKHVGDIMVRKGQKVERGQTVAKTGNSGISFVPHIHYEIRYRGEIVDPLYYMFQGISPEKFFETILVSLNSGQSLD